MTTLLQEQALLTEQLSPPMGSPFRQSTVWDESQHVGFVLSTSNLHNQSIFYNPYVQTQPRRDLNAQIRVLQRHYVISGNDRSVLELLELDPTLFVLLIEAVQPLRRAFGDNLLRIRVQQADDDSLLKAAVQLRREFPAPEVALETFDREWWINNCHRSPGTLVFDYEFRDAV